jgi:hypothetical protein
LIALDLDGLVAFGQDHAVPHRLEHAFLLLRAMNYAVE